MGEYLRRLLVGALGVALIMSLSGITGCSGEDEEISTDESTVETGQDEEADNGLDTEEGVSEAELRKDALDIAKAWFVGPETDYTSDQFDWTVESLVKDDEGTWWARVKAEPVDSSMDTEQVYVNRPVGMTLFYPVGRAPDVDPATGDQFPEEVRDKLKP